MTQPIIDGERIVAHRNADREEQRRRNREAGPNLAAMVDDLMKQFPGSKVMWGKDLITGFEVGKRPEDVDPDKVFRIPPGYNPTREVVETKRKKETKK